MDANKDEEIANLSAQVDRARNALGYDEKLVVQHLREWPAAPDALSSEYVGRLMREAADVIEFGRTAGAILRRTLQDRIDHHAVEETLADGMDAAGPAAFHERMRKELETILRAARNAADADLRAGAS